MYLISYTSNIVILFRLLATKRWSLFNPTTSGEVGYVYAAVEKPLKHDKKRRKESKNRV